jgi:hypothetical protein
MLARLPFGNLGVAQEPTDMVSSWLTCLIPPSSCGKWEPAVSDVSKYIQPGKPAHAQGRSHAGTIRIAPTEIRRGFVDLRRVLRTSVEIDCQAGRGALNVGGWQRDLVNGDPPAFSGPRAACHRFAEQIGISESASPSCRIANSSASN